MFRTPETIVTATTTQNIKSIHRGYGLVPLVPLVPLVAFALLFLLAELGIARDVDAVHAGDNRRFDATNTHALPRR